MVTFMRAPCLPALLLFLLPAACALPRRQPASAGGRPGPGNPRLHEVALPARAGWNAFLLFDNGSTGIWTVESYPVFPQYGSPEVVGADDLGRLWVLISYSGKWTPLQAVNDGKWLGGLAHGDVDPRIEGAELYAGSQRGNVYQVVAWHHGALDSRLIAHLPGKEIHTLVAGDFDPRNPGPELLIFTRPGALYEATPTGADGTFETRLLQVLPGRVRDAVALPPEDGGLPAVATVSRAGLLQLLRFTEKGPVWSLIHAEAMGMGRIALRPPETGKPLVLYSTLDDGRILRHERQASGAWKTETIYLGSQGARGVAAGPFDADPGRETVAVFGYSGKVELLTRTDEGWKGETLFRDRDKGHWLAAAELDGRNATREILLSGYGGRIVMLARPPGYGRPEIRTAGDD